VIHMLPLLSILSPIQHLLRHVLDWLHSTVGLPWAWSIVALTVIVRMILVPLTVRQIHSMQNLQRHAPQMKEIQRKYKNDKKRQQEELMKFYRENQINPASSCLPLLAQFPVFIALYFVLKDFAKEAGQPGSAIYGDNFHWLGLINITEKVTVGWGPLLLVIYVGSQFASTFFMSTTMDKTQRTIMLILPFILVSVVIRFPAGLLLYWVTTNLWTVGQGLVTRRLVPKTPAPQLSFRRSSRGQPKAEGGGEPVTAQAAVEKPKTDSQPPKQPQVRKVRRKKRSSGRR
jgi:YidC/Oxa1 family membrane protein insertase